MARVNPFQGFTLHIQELIRELTEDTFHRSETAMVNWCLH